MKANGKMKRILPLAAILSTSPALIAGGIVSADEFGIENYYSHVDTSVVGAAKLDEGDLDQGIVYDDVDYTQGPTVMDAPAEQRLEPVAFVGDTVYPSSETPPLPITDATTDSAHHPSYAPSMSSSMSHYDSMACGSGACGGTSCPPAKKLMPRRSMACQTEMWLTSEALLWFPRARSAPALVTRNDSVTGVPGGVLPNLGTAGTVSVFGGESAAFASSDAIDGGMSGGFRFDAGVYLSDGIGVGGRFWWIGDNEADFNVNTTANATSLGALSSFGRPFFNTETNVSDSVPVAYDNDFNVVDQPGVASFTGTIAAQSAMSMYGAEAYARLAMLTGNGFRADLIGGYSHFGLDDELSMTSLSIQTNDDGNNVATVSTRYSDLLQAENSFHGGQIGIETILQRGGWTLRSLTKVHLGNMEQVLTGVGQTTFTDAALTTTTEDFGFFTYDGFDRSADVFTFAPELNLKLGYQFRENIALTVGYSFLFWDRVAMVGNNINNVIDSDALVVGNPEFGAADQRPAQGLRDESFWVQGIDLGAVIEF